jgi:hypothetical protein
MAGTTHNTVRPDRFAPPEHQLSELGSRQPYVKRALLLLHTSLRLCPCRLLRCSASD